MSTSNPTQALTKPPTKLDYSLTGVTAQKAVERGLAEADWYQCYVPRETMRSLLERRNGPAFRDTLVWFALLFGTGYATIVLWGQWWAALPYAAYAVLYSSSSDSRWHEAGHGTAFKTDWMNDILYEMASFMVMRESTVWRWSHTRHHSDTIIVGRDPEIAVPRPPDVSGLIMGFFNLGNYPLYYRKIVLHSTGRMTDEERTFIPATEFGQVFVKARIYVAIYSLVLFLSVYLRSVLPLMLVGLPNLFGSWLMVVYGMTQHAGLAENVLDHRLNCRTVYMNIVHRYLYWNMNYHVEHHMFPLVPYHALPRLHAVIKDDCPQAYPSILAAWKEIVPAVLMQVKDPAYHVRRKLPAPKTHALEAQFSSDAKPDALGWLEICAAADLGLADVLRFDSGRKTYALYRTAEGSLFATDGICTHGNTHLADGLVIGGTIECPKHNGRFNLDDGSPARPPVCRGLATYPIEERRGRIFLNLSKAGGAGVRPEKTYQFRVISNHNVATFIKELVLEPVNVNELIAFEPGDYLQFDIPTFAEIRFLDFNVSSPYSDVWHAQHVFDLMVSNPHHGRRNNYSIASNQRSERCMRFNIRIATPPPGQDCPPGIGSAYMFSLKPGDKISAVGPFGDFHLKPTQREMVFIGGGAGMAPLRAQLSHLLETEHSARKISFWYGARSRQEIFYDDYFRSLAALHPNFEFHLVLSSPLPTDAWKGHTGFVHEVVLESFLSSHHNPRAVEYYLCGPPMMIKACSAMLESLEIPRQQIAYDEF